MEKYRVLADDLKLGDIVEDTHSQYPTTCRFQVIGFTNKNVLMQHLSGSPIVYSSSTNNEIYPFELKSKHPWYKIN